MPRNKQNNKLQTSLDFTTAVEPSMKWPPNNSFPLNRKTNLGNLTVLEEIIKDVNDSSCYTVVTGFTSLAHIIEFFGSKVNYDKTKEVRFVLGYEPDLRTRKKWNKVSLENEIKEYWLENDYSILHGSEIMYIIDLVEKGTIKFRILDSLHAKIYVGDKHSILGSSNFSKKGTLSQLEANIRLENSEVNPDERLQYERSKQIAENYYSLAKDYNAEIIELLKNLLKVVTWEEALARAIAELLDGNWYKDIPELFSTLNSIKLWPSQRMALGQALYILQTQGCVLIADPTGSGKTKLISTLQMVLTHWLWDTGRKNKSYNLTICPPLVIPNWTYEFIDIRFSQSSQVSMGVLSNTNSLSHQNALRQIKTANILVIDEAHNYLSSNSNRSNNLASHTADHIILSTATPINKKPKDLLRLIEILDPDNLNDFELDQFKQLRKLPSIKKSSDLQLLKGYIKKFIVRRTKKQLNQLILKEPHLYTDKNGNECCYPSQKTPTYPTNESERDKVIAEEITELSSKLKGIVFLQDLGRPDFEYEFDDSTYIEQRIRIAQALSIYNIQAKLRSSKVALIEHIEGTDSARELYDFKTSKQESGNFLKKLKNRKKSLPQTDFDLMLLPDWLTQLAAYQSACDEEMAVYKQISKLAKTLSDRRELAKINLLIKLFEKHKLVVAFDSTIITLDYFKKLLKERKKESKIDTYVVTGNTPKTTVLQKLELGSQAERVLALCSDSMSEGVNLQQASTVVFLDMPSVLRIADQRIGRIDRLDSPHKEIEIYWPNDSREFALKTDLKLIKTSLDAENLIGSNFSLPPEILDKHFTHIVTADEMINAIKESDDNDLLWEGMQDAFKPVHDLYQGNDALIKTEDYDYLKNVNATVKVKLSIGYAKNPWLFLAVKGGKNHSPKWYFIDKDNNIFSDLGDICQQLRSNINDTTDWEERWTDSTKNELSRYLTLLQKREIQLLPNKRKRALEVAKHILEKHRSALTKSSDPKLAPLLDRILSIFKPSSIDDEEAVDYYQFSQLWLDFLNPYLHKKRANRKRKKELITLTTLKKDWQQINLSVHGLQEILERIDYLPQIWTRVVSCIIGIPRINS